MSLTHNITHRKGERWFCQVYFQYKTPELHVHRYMLGQYFGHNWFNETQKTLLQLSLLLMQGAAIFNFVVGVGEVSPTFWVGNPTSWGVPVENFILGTWKGQLPSSTRTHHKICYVLCLPTPKRKPHFEDGKKMLLGNLWKRHIFTS